MGIVAALAVVVLYVASLPAAYNYVAFMKVEKTAYLKIPFNWLFSIFIVFSVAIIVRYLWILSPVLRNREPDEADSGQDRARGCEPLRALRRSPSSRSACSACRSGTP